VVYFLEVLKKLLDIFANLVYYIGEDECDNVIETREQQQKPRERLLSGFSFGLIVGLFAAV